MKKNTTTAKCTLTVEMWAIGRVKPYPKNARKLSDKAVAKVAASLKEFGWRQPCVVDKKGVLVAGHTRLLAAQSLGMTEVPVHVAANLTPVQVRAYRLADNRVAAESSFDLELLGPELLELQALDLDLSLTGFDADELKMFMADPTEGLTDPDDCPAPQAQAISVAGDLWLLGEHRLLCGDSTSVTDVERLMAGEKADLLFTDPPYGVSFERGKYQGNNNAPKFAPIENDALEGQVLEDFIRDSMLSAFTVMKDAPIYVWSGSSPKLAEGGAVILRGILAAGFTLQSQIIWRKTPFVLGRADYHWQHEICWYGFKGQNHPWYGGRNKGTVWDAPKLARMVNHPTEKPVSLAETALHNSTKADDLCLDLFLGSGSTLIAAEKTSRRCFGMELSPQYVDCIIRRWQSFTGKQATLEVGGRTFAELEAERSTKSAAA